MINSMTAFARTEFKQAKGTFIWEIRSVNNRYLDANMHLPEAFREIEMELRMLIKKYVSRGKVDCGLHYQIVNGDINELAINENNVKKLNTVTKQIKKIFGKAVSINLIDILKWPGVTQILEGDKTNYQKIVTDLFEQALIKFNETRAREGEALKKFIEDYLDGINLEVKKVRTFLPEIITSQRDKLIHYFEEAKIKLDNERLEQEMVFYAQKADVAEELDRLETHIKEVKRLLQNGGIVGRRLDFLMQELNREANTLGSKSVNEITTHAAVEIKVLIEQMREQIQNIE